MIANVIAFRDKFSARRAGKGTDFDLQSLQRLFAPLNAN
jgi:hypothetical protein